MATITKPKTEHRSKPDKKSVEKFMEVSVMQTDVWPHTMASVSAVANLQAYFCELILKHYANPTHKQKLDELTDNLRVIQKDLNWVATLKAENQAIKHLLTRYHLENIELRKEVEKLKTVLNAEMI